MNWLTFIALVIIIGACVLGFAKGAGRMAVWLAAVIVSALLMWILMPQLKKRLFDKTELEQSIYERVYAKLDSGVKDGEVPLETFYSLHLPDPIEISVIEKFRAVEGGVSEKIEYTSRHLAKILVAVAIAGRVFLFFFITLMLLSMLLKLNYKSKDKLTTFDHVLGGLFGLVEGIALVDMILLLVNGVGYMGFGTGIMEKITNDWFLGGLYDHNILLKLIKGTYTPTSLY